MTDSRTVRFVTPAEAVAAIGSGTAVAIGGTGSGHLVPETLLRALEQRYLETGGPSDLVVVHTMGLGDNETSAGIGHFAHLGMVRYFVGSHYAANRSLMKMLLAGELGAYVLPAGVIAQLYREIAAKRPGVFTQVGMGTFVDPNQDGARTNPALPEYVRRVRVLDQDVLAYPSFPLQVGIIRASHADRSGNLTMIDEPALGDNLAIAQAVHNSGGIVIVQVRSVVAEHALPCRTVDIPGCLVDLVVSVPDEPVTYATVRSDAYSGRFRVPRSTVEPLPLGPRKLIARRACLELSPGSVTNLGFGVANGVATVLAEESLPDYVILTVEQGPYGGSPAAGMDAGAAINHDALIDVPAQFDFYDGGGLQQAFLSFAQVDPQGRVNVSRFADRLTGPGGFIDISHRAGQVVFCGTLCAGGNVEINDSEVCVGAEGMAKFVSSLDQITYDPAVCANQRPPVYVTERAVFELRDGHLTLTEVAPGLTTDEVLAAMAFRPMIAEHVATMARGLLAEEPGYVGSRLREQGG